MLSELTREDLDEVMRIERLPGYDALVGRWDHDVHAAEMASPDARYFAWREAHALIGFAILQAFNEPTVRLRRIAVAEPGRGAGTRLLRAVIDQVLETTQAQAVDLQVKSGNLRAKAVYLREGFNFTVSGDGDDHEGMVLTRQAWTRLARRNAK